MFGFRKTIGKNKQLEAAIDRLQMNMSNNYKDAAQVDYKELMELYRKLEESNALPAKQREYYKGVIEEYNVKMENYTHKDQKPYWVSK